MDLEIVMIFVLSLCLASSIIYIIYLKRLNERKEHFSENLMKDYIKVLFVADYYNDKYDNEFEKVKEKELEEIMRAIERNNFETINERRKERDF